MLILWALFFHSLMKQSKLQVVFFPPWTPLCPGSIAPLCSSSQGFRGPFIPERHPSFQRHHGQFVNILPSLRARRNQALQSSAWRNKHSVCPALSTLQQVQFPGCYFADQMYLVLTWSWSKYPRLCTPWLPPASSKASPWLPLESTKWVSHTELLWGGCSGAWLKPSHLCVGVLCPHTRRTAWNTGRSSILHG